MSCDFPDQTALTDKRGMFLKYLFKPVKGHSKLLQTTFFHYFFPEKIPYLPSVFDHIHPGPAEPRYVLPANSLDPDQLASEETN